MTDRQIDKIDVAVICEQYKNLDSGVWVADKSGKAAIWTCGNQAIEETTKILENGFTTAKIGGIPIYSCYAAPSLTTEEFHSLVERLVTDAHNHSPKIVAGDFNAWAEEWGSRETNARGRILLEALSRLNLVVANTGCVNTVRKREMGSLIDVTFVSDVLAKDLQWYVSDEYTHSHHQAIIF